jgi:hypothetical protein
MIAWILLVFNVLLGLALTITILTIKEMRAQQERLINDRNRWYDEHKKVLAELNEMQARRRKP